MRVLRLVLFLASAAFFNFGFLNTAHAADFSCGTSGTYGVTSGTLANYNDPCFGAVTLDASVTTIEYSTYFTEVTSISIPATTLVIPNGAFVAPKLVSISVHPDNPNFSSSDGILYSKDGKKLIVYPSSRPETSFTVASSIEEINSCAFRQPFYLETVTVPSSVLLMDSGFLSCSVVDSSLSAIDVDAANPNYSSVDGVLFNKNKTTLISYPSSKRAKSFTVPASVTRLISLATTRYLESIILPVGLVKIDTYAFQGSFELKSIDIPASVTDFGNYPFIQSAKFETFTVASASTTLKAIDGVLYSKNGLTLIEYPEGKKNEKFEIQDGVTTVLGQWVWGNPYLKKIYVPSSVLTIAYGYINSSASAESLLNFRGNSSLTSIAGQYATKINYCGTSNAVITAFAASSSAVLSCQSLADFSLSTSSENITVGQSVVGYSLNIITAPDEYSIAPVINNGTLAFNPVTGLISGTPATSATTTAYTISGINISGAFSRVFTLTIQSIPNSNQDALALAAQKAAEAKREAEKKAARLGIYNDFIDYKSPNFQIFNTAEIYGVTAKNYYYVTNEIQYLMWKYNNIYSGQDIKALAYLWNYNNNSVMWNYQTNTLVRDESATALSWNLNSTMHVVENVVLKYSIMDSMCQPGIFSQYSGNDLSSVGLIPTKYQSLITYYLRKTPLNQRDDYYKIMGAIQNEIALIQLRELRLSKVLSWNLIYSN
jgi:hypothetical protein